MPAEAPCWRECGRPARDGSLSCQECADAGKAAHDAIVAAATARYARSVAAANQESHANRMVACARCGAPGAVLARWTRDERQEADRKTIERELRSGHGLDGRGAFLKSIALASPAGNFDPEDECQKCRAGKYDATFWGD